MNSTRKFGVVLVLALFTAVGVLRHLHMFGEDLASSYVGCRLVAEGNASRLYRHDPVDFSKVHDEVWDRTALSGGYTELRLLHPYVQTPLWAWSLRPLCMGMRFRIFCDLFIVLLMLCTSATIWLTARFWTPVLLKPGSIALVYAGLYLSEPFKYSIFLAQTHIFILFFAFVALLLEEHDRPVLAGLALAVSAAIKITPGLLLVYWLVTGRWKAALTFVCAFVALTAATVLAVGPEVTRAYFHSLAENGNTLLVSFNNQSLAGWWMGRAFDASEAEQWRIHALPLGVKICSLVLSLLSAVGGGLLDRTRPTRDQAGRPALMPPYGAVLTLLAATMFAPIAWTHYYILLLVPAMLLLSAFLTQRRWLWLALAAALFVLNVYPISYGAVDLVWKGFSVLRSQFYSGLIAMAALVLLRQQRAFRGEVQMAQGSGMNKAAELDLDVPAHI